MRERIDIVTAELHKVAADAQERFGGLSAGQLNWKPDAESWSIAQCFDHLIVIHSLYFPVLQRLATGEFRPSPWERISPFSGIFGRFLIRSMRPENLKKTKTSAKAQPSTSEIGGEVISRFAAHQDDLIDHLRKLPHDIDPTATIIASPLMGLITYSLDDTFTILCVHCQRHLGQAKRVAELKHFPENC